MSTNRTNRRSCALAYLLDKRGHSKLLDDMSRPTSPFRFLDLPKEIRYMVYERIDISATPFQCIDTSDSSVAQPSLILRTYTLPVQILATCRIIHSEACCGLEIPYPKNYRTWRDTRHGHLPRTRALNRCSPHRAASSDGSAKTKPL
jgi:hypothetical protein